MLESSESLYDFPEFKKGHGKKNQPVGRIPRGKRSKVASRSLSMEASLFGAVIKHEISVLLEKTLL